MWEPETVYESPRILQRRENLHLADFLPALCSRPKACPPSPRFRPPWGSFSWSHSLWILYEGKTTILAFSNLQFEFWKKMNVNLKYITTHTHICSTLANQQLQNADIINIHVSLSSEIHVNTFRACFKRLRDVIKNILVRLQQIRWTIHLTFSSDKYDFRRL